MRKRSAIIFTGLVSLIIVTYLGYDLLKGIVSPCETIYEQTSVRLGTKLEILQTKGELHVGREKVQDLTEAAQVTALNLKTCCIVLDEGGVDSAEFLQCKNAAQNYEAEIETVVASIEEADSTREAGDTAAYEKLVSRIEESLEQALQASETLEKEVNAIVDSEETNDTDRPSTASTEPTGNAIEQAMGELAFTWDGKTQTYWSIFQADASGDYQKVADTGWLQKGQTQVVELAPGDYRVAMYWDRGFEPQDVTVGPGRSLSVHPAFGTIAFTWGGRSQANWNILQADAFGDYHEVAQTDWLQKGQTQVVELAPGDYRVALSWDRGFEPQDVTVAIDRNVAIDPAFGTVTFQWDGRAQAHWNILQADAFGDYHKVAATDWLQKGQTQIVELAPGDYRVSMHWDHGFEPEDVIVKIDENVAINPIFGTITFRWDGESQTYWDILQLDSFGDYVEVAETGWLQSGQTQVVDVAPGEYWVRRQQDAVDERKLVVEVGGDILVTQ